MGTPGSVEKTLTWLGTWKALQGFPALTAAVVVSVVLLELLVPSALRLFPRIPVGLLHLFSVALGILLGLIGSYAGDSWDRAVFDVCYGTEGQWLHRSGRPLLLFPAGADLAQYRDQATHALQRKAGTVQEIYREAIKLARRQPERWERIQHPLILSNFVRSFLWPCVLVSVVSFLAAVGSALRPDRSEVARLLPLSGSILGLTVLLVLPYLHFRVEHMIRLYAWVASHAARKKTAGK